MRESSDYAFDNPRKLRVLVERDCDVIERVREERPVDPKEFLEHA